MQIIKKNLRQGEVTLKINNPEDLWYLDQVIETDDRLKGKTERKIKIGGEDDRKQRITRKKVFLEIQIEKTEFHKHSQSLRASGKISQGPDDISKGSYHSFSIEPGTVVTLKKQEWMGYQLEKLKQASQESGKGTLVVLLDREEALFALIKSQGWETLSKLSGDVEKKGIETAGQKNFYAEIISKLKDYDQRLEPENIVVASPSFWKEYLMKEMPDELKPKIILSKCSDIRETAVKEVMNRPELSRVLEQDRAAQETRLLDQLLKAISKDKACYGLKDCKEKISMGAVEELMISYDFLQEKRLENRHRAIEKLMKTAEQMKAKVHIFSTEKASEKLKGLGGIAGILRWEQK